ncbi:MAG: radical SAM protein [Eubacteriales bacterium]|nr:radical SAM protein [Eubacteriales bacterium]
MFKRIYLEITNVCNLRCSFCPGTVREKHFLSPEEFRLLAAKLRPYTDYLYFHVMGEPLLHPQLGALLAIAHELGFRVCLTTNGTLLGKVQDVLLASPALHKVSISLHSFEGNDRQEGMSDYLDGVWQFCRRAAAQGTLCALRLWNEGGQDQRNGDILRYLSGQLGFSVETTPVDARGNRRLCDRIFLQHAEKFDWPDLSAQERHVQFCHGLSQQIAVLCDGTVVPCCLDGQGAIPLGNLFSDDLSAILDSPRATSMREGFRRRQPQEELCRKCGYATRFNK